MESSQNAEVLSHAIQKPLEEKRDREATGDSFVEDEDDQLILSRLLTQLEARKGSGAHTPPEEGPVEPNKTDGGSELSCGGRDEMKEVAKEIKHLKRQNNITHLLLSGLIMLTLAWQFSEFSILLKLKNGVAHPFKSFGNMLFGKLKGSPSHGVQLPEKQSYPSKEGKNRTKAPSLKLPEAPNQDWKQLGLDDED